MLFFIALYYIQLNQYQEETKLNYKLLSCILLCFIGVLSCPIQEFNASQEVLLYTEQNNDSFLLHAESSSWLDFEVTYSNQLMQIDFPKIDPKQVKVVPFDKAIHDSIQLKLIKRGIQIICQLDQFPYVRLRASKSNSNLIWSFSKTTWNYLAGKTIILDPGHGAFDEETMSIYDSGVLKNGLVESELNLQIAKELKRRLEDHGATVILTRENEEDTSTILFKPRIQFINTVRPDIYLAIHHNDSDEEEPNGVFVYYNEIDSKGFAEYLFREVSQEVKLKQNHILTDPLVSLSSLNVPVAVLLECSFLSSKIDVNIVKQPEYITKMATGIENAFRHFVEDEQHVND